MTSQTHDPHHYPETVDELVEITDMPVVVISQEGLFTFINTAFEEQYGWTSDDLLHKEVGKIMPPHLRDAHKIGLSRFLTTEKPVLLGTKLPLAALHKDGTIENAEHYIIGDKKDGQWRFAAIINPRPSN